MPPFYTGKQKLVDTGGRVERFRRRQAVSRNRRIALLSRERSLPR